MAMTTEPKTDFVIVPREPDEEMTRAALAANWPAMYRNRLLSPNDGPATRRITEERIQQANNAYRAMIAAAPSLENRGVEPYTDASARDCPAADDQPLPVEIEFAQAVLRPLAFRVQGRAAAGENVAIGQRLRAEIERALTMAADLIEARAGAAL